ncbi:MAG: alpha/beta hydrolase [Oliverpabstia sp.]
MRVFKIILKIAGCFVLFVIAFAGSFLGSVLHIASAPQKPLKVDWNEQTGKIYENLPYENEFDNCYDLYVPAGLDKEKDQALVLYIHGGGFTGGSKSSGKNWCRFLASNGYIAASVDYTVHNKEHASNVNRMNQEIESCVEAIQRKCQELGYCVTQMATTGESAGGCLAMLYAYSHPKNSAIPVKFVFQQTGPAHFDPDGWGGNGDSEHASAFLSMMTGVDITKEMVDNGEAEKYMEAISPAFLVDENTVPTLCAYGPKDKVVPPALKFKLFEAFEEYGVSYDYIEFPNSNHIMYSDPDKQEEYITKVMEYCDKYFGY